MTFIWSCAFLLFVRIVLGKAAFVLDFLAKSNNAVLSLLKVFKLFILGLREPERIFIKLIRGIVLIDVDWVVQSERCISRYLLDTFLTKLRVFFCLFHLVIWLMKLLLRGPEDVYNGHLPNRVVANTLEQPKIGVHCDRIRYQVASSVKYHVVLLDYFRWYFVLAMDESSSDIAYNGEPKYKTVNDHIEFDDEPQIRELFCLGLKVS